MARALVLGGIVITVQASRPCATSATSTTRHAHLGLAGGQVAAATIYVGIVVVATRSWAGHQCGRGQHLLDITRRASPLLVLPLVISAVLSQLSAAIADTASADGNLRGLWSWMKGPRPFVVSGIAAVALAATVPTYTIVAVASRAFAAYYALLAVVALRTSSSLPRKIGYGALAVLMLAIAALAEPAGRGAAHPRRTRSPGRTTPGRVTTASQPKLSRRGPCRGRSSPRARSTSASGRRSPGPGRPRHSAGSAPPPGSGPPPPRARGRPSRPRGRARPPPPGPGWRGTVPGPAPRAAARPRRRVDAARPP